MSKRVWRVSNLEETQIGAVEKLLGLEGHENEPRMRQVKKNIIVANLTEETDFNRGE